MSAEAGDPSKAAADTLTPGEWLRQERERHSLSVQQAAEDLRLDPWIVEAIEDNRFAALGAPVYAKGHLRKYALLLGLAPEAVIERYQALHDTPEVPTPIPATLAAPMPRERKPLPVPLWILGILVLVALAWLIVEAIDGSGESVEVEAPAVAPPVESTVPVAEEPVHVQPEEPPAAEPASADAGASQEPSVAAEAPAETAAPPAASSSAGEVSLVLEFREPAWAEIHDANGARLMFDMGSPERPRTLRGVPPFRITLGRAAAVRVSLDGRAVTIPQRPGRDLAKFVLAADGSTAPGAQ